MNGSAALTCHRTARRPIYILHAVCSCTYMPKIHYTRFPVDREAANLFRTCCRLVSDTANKSATSLCNGICETTRHNRLLPAPTCCGLAMGKQVQWILVFTPELRCSQNVRRFQNWKCVRIQRYHNPYTVQHWGHHIVTRTVTMLTRNSTQCDCGGATTLEHVRPV